MGTAEVALGRLYRDVAEEKLDLLQLPAGGAAEPSATSTKIMRCEFGHADFGGELLDDVPY